MTAFASNERCILMSGRPCNDHRRSVDPQSACSLGDAMTRLIDFGVAIWRLQLGCGTAALTTVPATGQPSFSQTFTNPPLLGPACDCRSVVVVSMFLMRSSDSPSPGINAHHASCADRQLLPRDVFATSSWQSPRLSASYTNH